MNISRLLTRISLRKQNLFYSRLLSLNLFVSSSFPSVSSILDSSAIHGSSDSHFIVDNANWNALIAE